jgi:hypothetical protein
VNGSTVRLATMVITAAAERTLREVCYAPDSYRALVKVRLIQWPGFNLFS